MCRAPSPCRQLASPPLPRTPLPLSNLRSAAVQVDAALDESNQALVATLIKVLFL